MKILAELTFAFVILSIAIFGYIAIKDAKENMYKGIKKGSLK